MHRETVSLLFAQIHVDCDKVPIATSLSQYSLYESSVGRPQARYTKHCTV